jgi:L-ascorbate metabolism protein UlaG (beta-lactamase superfamily)
MAHKSGRSAGLGGPAVILSIAVLAMAVCSVPVRASAETSDSITTSVPPVDFNRDEWVDFDDFALLAEHWRGADTVTDIAPSPADGLVDFRDLSALAQYWLREVAQPIYITWLGHSSVKIVWMDQVIYVDPLDLTTSPKDATLILVTHSHSDHYSPADIARVWGTATQIIAPADTATTYPNKQSLLPGQTIQVGYLRIIGVWAYNINKTNHPKANNWVGFIVQIGSRRIYMAGDTDLTPEMKALTDIDVAFLPVSGTYTMTAAEAADATKYFMPGLAIPYHWGRTGNPGTLADAQLFVQNAACNAKVMTKGETISSEDWSKDFSLAAYWKLDETEGDIAHDSAGTNDGTVFGSATWQPAGGMVGGALLFDGVDDYVSTPFVVNPTAGAFSAFAWVKGGGAGQVILSQKKGSDWLMASAADGTLATELKASRGGKTGKSSVSIIDGAWHRVGLAWDGSNRILYVDDAQAAKDPQTSLTGTTDGLIIGAGNATAPGTFWMGLIDDIRLHNRAIRP